MSTNEQQVAMGMAITCLCITAIAALVAAFALVFGIIDGSITEIVVGLVMGSAAGTAGWGTVQLLDRVNPDRIHTRNVESVLNYRQRRDLRRARGAVVMEKALLEVENERDNITHQALEAANDDSKPPHETQWSSRERYDSPTLNARERYDDRNYRS